MRLPSDDIIPYHLIIFTVLLLDGEQISFDHIHCSFTGWGADFAYFGRKKPVLICCLGGSLWPAESDKASLQSSPCGNETQHITCSSKCILFL